MMPYYVLEIMYDAEECTLLHRTSWSIRSLYVRIRAILWRTCPLLLGSLAQEDCQLDMTAELPNQTPKARRAVCSGAVRALGDIPRNVEIRLFVVPDCFTLIDIESLWKVSGKANTGRRRGISKRRPGGGGEERSSIRNEVDLDRADGKS